MAARGGMFERRRRLRVTTEQRERSGRARPENPPSLVATVEKMLGEESGTDLSELSAWQRGSEGPSCSHNDPYADSSLIFGPEPTLPMDKREAKALVMKRKVLRHRPDGRVEVSDESLNAKPWSLGNSRAYMDDTIPKEEIEASSGTLEDYLHYDDDDWLLEDSRGSLLGDFGSDTISEYPIPGRPPTAYIAPRAERQRRTDPVARLNKYRQDWERFSFPGQDSHQDLRWAVRRQMLQPGLPHRPQRRHVPNTYEVPTAKKRDSLRFGVRWDLANHLMPNRNSSS